MFGRINKLTLTFFIFSITTAVYMYILYGYIFLEPKVVVFLAFSVLSEMLPPDSYHTSETDSQLSRASKSSYVACRCFASLRL
jgi:hypothetical protein